MKKQVFVGFGFGAIQGGLSLYEAYRSGRFKRLVVAEVAPDVVQAVRDAGGRYCVNIATRTGRTTCEVEGIEALNPNESSDRALLVEAVSEAHELCTALPSVDFYDRGEYSVAAIVAAGLDAAKAPSVLYAAENHNHAAEILEKAVRKNKSGLSHNCQFLNTVIGKMSGVVVDPAEIDQANLSPITPTLRRAFLVEEFNRILVTRIDRRDFERGISVFEEKTDLLPFEEAKLYGHNAAHSLLGYLAKSRGYRFVSEAGKDQALMKLAREAFLEESGRALVAKYGGVDELFTKEGFRAYADDLLERMTNPWLRDAVDRVVRDPGRKLAWNDRLIGTMRLALDAGVAPLRFARGAAAALEMLMADAPPGFSGEEILGRLWPEPDEPKGRKRMVMDLIFKSAKLDNTENL